MVAAFHERWARRLGVLAFASLWGVLASTAYAQSGSPTPQPSFMQSLTSGFRQPAAPNPAKPSDDPVSLQSKGKPGIELYVAVARLYEESGKFPEAEAQYQRALQEAPDDLRPLLGYARLQDRLGQPQEAQKLYERAARAHAREPAVYNNMSIHYARCGMIREAIGALDRAIQLRPYEPRYRNNMAMLLVDVGRPQEAYFHLQAVYDEAMAHYNLGYLLNKKGQTPAAAQEFAVALRLNPALLPAHQWLERLPVSPRLEVEPPRYDTPPREELRIAAEPRPPRLDAPSQGPLATRATVPEPMAVPPFAPPPQTQDVNVVAPNVVAPSPDRAMAPQDSARDPQPPSIRPPQPETAVPRRLPPVSDSDEPESVPPYLPSTR